jgi:hypothetical protein
VIGVDSQLLVVVGFYKCVYFVTLQKNTVFVLNYEEKILHSAYLAGRIGCFAVPTTEHNWSMRWKLWW